MKIMGLPLWGVLAASVAFYFVGFLWYGIAFSEMWRIGNGVSIEAAEAGSPSWLLVGFLISLANVIGIGTLLKWRGWPDIGGAIGTAVTAAIFFGAATWAYDYVYLPDHNLPLLIMNSAHLVVGWIIAAIILTLMK